VHDNTAPAGVANVGLLLRLEHAVAELVVDPRPTAEFFDALLGEIGDRLGWPFGAAWTVHGEGGAADGGDPWLGCVSVWHASGAALYEFAEASRRLTLRIGVGLPGRVWQSGQPAWIRDTRGDANMPRALAAARAGLGAAFCFPAVSRDGVEALVEFFATSALDPAPELLATVSSLGGRIGDALRRQRVDDAVRRSEARLRAVIDSALDCVVIADAAGRVIEFNPAACQTFGYRHEEAVGRELADLIVPPHLRDRHRAGLRRYLETGRARSLDRRLEIEGMRADGSTFPVELTITRVPVAGTPVFAAYLRDLTERRRSDAELRASRRRVVEAAIAERQRLERDLHDGAQQRLLSLGMTLVRARDALAPPPGRVAGLLDEAIGALEEAAVELRNLARGIHPSSLTRYGLAAALTDLARRSSLDLELGPLPIGRFPPSVEATAYFVVAEALTNVARHAGTDRARVEVSVQPPGALLVVVTDWGIGGATVEAGSGIRGLADRVALLDGELRLTSGVGAGTVVSARIPLPDSNVESPANAGP
jgi:PAS domain S-box-containing protein